MDEREGERERARALAFVSWNLWERRRAKMRPTTELNSLSVLKYLGTLLLSSICSSPGILGTCPFLAPCNAYLQ